MLPQYGQGPPEVEDPTRRRPLMFRRNPAMPGPRMGPNGRPRDFGFMREQFARLARPPQPGGPMPGPNGRPMEPGLGAAAGEMLQRQIRPPVGPSLGEPPAPGGFSGIAGQAAGQLGGMQPAEQKWDTNPGTGRPAFAQSFQPSPDGGPQFDAAAEELKKRLSTDMPPAPMF